MNDKQRTATAAVIHHLNLSEAAKDRSLRADAELLLTMLDARRQAALHYGDGQSALEHLGRSMAAGIEARGHIVRSHARLAQLGGERRFDWTGMGDESETPAPTPTGELLSKPAIAEPQTV